MKQIFIAIIFSLSIHTALGAELLRAELTASAERRIGEPIGLSLTFTSVNEESVYLDFSGADYSPESLIVCAQRNDKWISTGNIHFDRDVSARRFDYIPLRRGQSFATQLMSINDPMASSLPILRLSEPGTYRIFARFTSKGFVNDGLIWPIWRGVITTPVQEISLTPPLPRVVAEHRRAVEKCASDAGVCEADAVGYFQIVRDAEAANVLAKMLDSSPIPDPELALAVAHQGGVRSDEAVRNFERRFPEYTKSVERVPSDEQQTCGAR